MTMNFMNDVKTKLIQAIDNTKTLSQEDLNQTFAKARILIDDGVLLLSSISQYPQNHFVQVATFVLNGRDANKAFYKRTASMSHERFSSPTKASARNRFLCDAMDMMAALVRDDLPAQQRILLHHNLTRNVFESCIDDLLADSAAYLDATHALVSAPRDQKFAYEQVVARIESKYACTKPHFLYGTIRHLRRLRAAIRVLYGRVLEAYTRIVLLNAKKTAGSIAQESDSFQFGSIGLMRAISLYDHCGNMRFANFATAWIRQSILYQLKDGANTIRVPLNVWQQFSRIERHRAQLEAIHGPLSYEDLADKLGMTVRSLSDIYTSIRAAHPESIDVRSSGRQSKGKDAGRPRIPSDVDSQPAVFNELLDTRVDDLQDLLDVGVRAVSPLDDLNYREKLVICLSYGLLDQLPPKTDTSEEWAAFEILVEKYRQRHFFRKSSPGVDTTVAQTGRPHNRHEVNQHG